MQTTNLKTQQTTAQKMLTTRTTLRTATKTVTKIATKIVLKTAQTTVDNMLSSMVPISDSRKEGNHFPSFLFAVIYLPASLRSLSIFTFSSTCFLCNGYAVKLEFDDGDKSIEDCMIDYINSLV